MSGHDDFDFEPIPGLPADLPPGEHIVWQGAPQAWPLARSALHVRKLAVYFTAILALRAVFAAGGGATLAEALASAAKLVPLAAAALALLALFAWLVARTTVYTITNRRVVMRFGIALPMTVNVPFRIVDTIGLRTAADGTGDVPLALSGSDRIAYLHLWPHARPLRLARPEPMLRSIPDAAHVGALMVQALAGAAPRAAAVPAPEAVDAADSGALSPAMS